MAARFRLLIALVVCTAGVACAAGQISKQEEHIRQELRSLDPLDDELEIQTSLAKLRLLSEGAYCRGLLQVGSRREAFGDDSGAVDAFREVILSCEEVGRALWLLSEVAVRRPAYCGEALEAMDFRQRNPVTHEDGFFAARGRLLTFMGCRDEMRQNELAAAAAFRESMAFGHEYPALAGYVKELIRYDLLRSLGKTEDADSHLRNALVIVSGRDGITGVIVDAFESEHVRSISVGTRLDAIGFLQELWRSSMFDDVDEQEKKFVLKLVREFRAKYGRSETGERFEPLLSAIDAKIRGR